MNLSATIEPGRAVVVQSMSQVERVGSREVRQLALGGSVSKISRWGLLKSCLFSRSVFSLNLNLLYGQQKKVEDEQQIVCRPVHEMDLK